MATLILTAHELVARHRLTEEELLVDVSHELFAYIVKVMNNWREIAPHLGLNPADREDIEEKKGTPKEQRLYMLERWKEKFGSEATFFKLVEVFLSAERRDLAEEVCEFFTQNENKNKAAVFFTPPDVDLLIVPGDSELTSLPGNHQTHEFSLTQQTRSTQTKNKDHSALYIGSMLACMYCLLCSGLPITFLVLGSTIYSPNVPPPGVKKITKDSVVLLGEFDPFYVANVTCTSHTSNAFFYKMQCQSLSTHIVNQTLEQFENIDIELDRKAYPIFKQYLVEGSELVLDFNFTAKQDINQKCIGYMYVWDTFAPYIAFLDYGTRSEFTDKQCISKETTPRYTLPAHYTQYYLIGLYLPDNTAFKSATVEITGYQLYFDLSQHQPDCVTIPSVRRTCILKLVTKQHRNNICILGKTPDNTSRVTYEAQGNPQVDDISSNLTILGWIIISFPLMCTMLFCLYFCIFVGYIWKKGTKN